MEGNQPGRKYPTVVPLKTPHQNKPLYSTVGQPSGASCPVPTRTPYRHCYGTRAMGYPACSRSRPLPQTLPLPCKHLHKQPFHPARTRYL